MSSDDDEDVCVCDTCDDIFLTKSGLEAHVKEKHEVATREDLKDEEEKPKRRMGPASQVKRCKSPSDNEEEKVVKKPKMGPRSRVKRDRSSSPEEDPKPPPKSVSPMFNQNSRSTSPDGPSIDTNIDKLVEGLASTESEPEKKEDGNEKGRDTDSGGDRHKMKKKKKHNI